MIPEKWMTHDPCKICLVKATCVKSCDLKSKYDVWRYVRYIHKRKGL